MPIRNPYDGCTHARFFQCVRCGNSFQTHLFRYERTYIVAECPRCHNLVATKQ